MSDVEGVVQPSALVVAEYESLRAECTTRIVQGKLMLALGLTASAGLATVGLTDGRDTHLVLAATPVILLFIALAWARNSRAHYRCAEYIRSVEKKFPEIQWETAGAPSALQIRGGRPAQFLLDYSGQLLFIVLSWGAVGLFLVQAEDSLADYVALGIGAAAGLIMTYAMLVFGPISPLDGSRGRERSPTSRS